MFDVVFRHDVLELVLDGEAHLGLGALQHICNFVCFLFVHLFDQIDVLDFPVVVEVPGDGLEHWLQIINVLINNFLLFCEQVIDYFPLVGWNERLLAGQRINFEFAGTSSAQLGTLAKVLQHVLQVLVREVLFGIVALICPLAHFLLF